MQEAYLPGGDKIELRKISVPKSGFGQVFLRMKCCTICGSDICCIFHGHVGIGSGEIRELSSATNDVDRL